MKSLKIFFLGRRSGYGLFKFCPWIIENIRKNENYGLSNAIGISQTSTITNADILFFRNKPEKTNDAIISKLSKRISPYKKNCLVINDINSFYNYDSKNIAFSLWEKSNISAPKYMLIENCTKNIIEQVYQFIKKHQFVFLRTNNETGSKGMNFVTDKISYNELKNIIINLLKRASINKLTRSDSKVMAVKFIDARVESGHLDIYRAHVLGNEIISYYVVTSKKNTFHNQDMTMNDIKRFIKINEKFGVRIKEDHIFRESIINAVKILNSNIGGIEFILKNNEPIFIEHNPMWGGRASRQGFGSQTFQKYIKTNKNELINRIPLLYHWLDYGNYYKSLYEKIRNLYISTM